MFRRTLTVFRIVVADKAKFSILQNGFELSTLTPRVHGVPVYVKGLRVARVVASHSDFTRATLEGTIPCG